MGRNSLHIRSSPRSSRLSGHQTRDRGGVNTLPVSREHHTLEETAPHLVFTVVRFLGASGSARRIYKRVSALARTSASFAEAP